MSVHQQSLDLAANVGALEQEATGLRSTLTTTERDLAAARARIAELEAGPTPTPKLTRIGMSAPTNLWPQRLADVGVEGLTARRIFIGPEGGMSIRSRRDEIEEAIENGMTPVLSFKETPTDANVAQLRAELEALDTDVTASYWHEPRGDMPTATFRARSKTFLGVKSDRIKVGPILNGFLLNRAATMAEWDEFSDAELLDAWDFLGVDLYQKLNGTEVPGSQIPALVKWLADHGQPGMDIVVGEYNSFEADSIAQAGETFLAVPDVTIACVWNSTGKPGSQEHIPLSGARLEAFRATKRDPRAAR